MRKILSIILTAAMTLSLFAAIPIGASAEASGSAITFDTQAEYDYYSNEPGKNSSGAPQETGTDQGKAFKFETIPGGTDGSVWASALRLAQENTDGTVSAFKVTPGKTYNISFKYKNDADIDQDANYSWAEIYVKLLFVSPVNGMGNFLNAAGIGPDDWWPRAEPGNISRNATDGWVQYSKSFTVPDWADPVSNSEVALVLNLAQTRQNVSFWVDDISIEESGTNLQTDKDTYAVSDPIMVTVNGENYASDAWVGIYEKDTVPGTYNSMAFVWYYLTDSGIGTTVNAFDLNKSNTNMKSLPEGEYIIYLFQDGGYNFVEQKELLVKNPVLPALESPSAVTYERTTEEAGKANGKLVITAGEGDLPKGYTAYWADANGKLEGYSSFAAVACSNAAVTEYQIPENTLIPNGADRIIVYAANGNTESNGFVSCMLPEKAADYDFGTPLYEIQVFSDVHLTNNADHLHNQHFAKVLEDVKKMSPNSAGIFINGDIADNGNEDEWQIFEKMIQDAGDGIPEVYCAVGNHELYWGRGMEVGLQNFLKYSQPCEDKPYGDIWIEGTHFIFLGSESQGMTAELSKTQLDWFYQKLAENRDVNRPIYVFLHEGLQNTVAGTFDGQDFGGGYCANGVNQAEQFSAILKEYPEVILFSGHSHWEMESANNMKVRDKNLPTIFNTAAVGYLWNDSAVNIEGAQGYFIKAYKDKVVVCGRDFLRDKWIASAQYIVDYPAKTDESDETYVDFEDEEQRTYYGDQESSKSTVTVGNPTGEANYAAKYDTLLTDNCTNAWNNTLRISMIYPNGTRGPVTVEAGEKYNISFKVKAETLDYSISKFYLCYAASVQSGYVLNGTTAPQDYQHKETITNWNSIDQMKAGWVSFSYDFTVPANIGDFNQLALFPVVSDGWQLKNQVVWIDDVSITRKTSVKVHNDSLGDFTISPAYGTNINDAKLPFPNVKVVNWYSDAERTQIFDGTVTYDTPELWVDIENIVGDFENGYDAAKDGWNGNTFYTEQYAGTTNSTALTNKGQAQTGIDNSAYSPIIKLINSDGSDFITVSGHTYKLSFDMKPVDRSNLSPTGIVAVMNKDHSDGKTLPCYSLINQETFVEQYAQTNISSAFSNEDDYYRTFEFTFDGTGNKVYITPWCAGTAVYFDNINIIDLTAQLDVTDSEGNVLASGLDGETVTIPDAADPDFVYYQDENGAPVSTTVVRKDKALTKVNSQIAVTGSAFDSANSTLSFTTRFGGIGYTETNGGVTVNTITVGNTRYFVEDMGLLVAPTANVTGELTLDNLCGAQQISGTSLKYSKNGTDELTITAQITTSKYDRDYTVVGYVKCAGGKVIYSKTRNSIAKSYNAAAGIESVDDTAHTRTFGSANYTLVSNSEFSSAESLSNGWNPWGQVINPSLTDPSKPDCNYYSVGSATYVDNGNLVLDLKRTGDNTYDLPELLSTYNFTTGYLEVRAKFANPSDFSCSIWLNSVALPDSDLTYKPNDTDIYVKPEIDIMESFAPGSFSFTLHNWGTPPGGEFGQRDQIRLNDKNTNADHTSLDLTQYHTYGLERTPQVIRMYVDGKLYYELTYAGALATYNTNKKPGDYQYRTVNEIKALFENPTYLILGAGETQSLAVGESAISTIDYVRFYK